MEYKKLLEKACGKKEEEEKEDSEEMDEEETEEKEDSEEDLEEGQTDMKTIQKAKSILKDADKSTLSALMKWLKDETDKVKL